MSRLMDCDSARDLAASALRLSRADQTEVGVCALDWALTRFANSSIHQNMSGANVLMRVRAVIGKRVAVASSNVTSEAGARSLVDSAVAMARLTDENPDFVSLPEPVLLVPSVDAFDDVTAVCTPAFRANAVRDVVDEAARVDGTAAGSFTTHVQSLAVANSLGVDSCFRRTGANLITVVTAPEGGFGYASAMAGSVAGIDPRAVGAEAANTAHSSRSPVDLAPGEYETILTPYAAADLIGYLRGLGFYALAVQEGRSFVCGKLGQKIVGENVSVWDDGSDPRTLMVPSDAEGIAKQRVDLVKDGVATDLLYDSYTAHREGRKSNGHAFEYDYEFARGWRGNTIMAPGNADVREMIQSTKRGVLVTRFHYTNVAHPMSGTITGMTRDGTFLVENGEIARPVRNLRFTQSILEALSCVEMLSRDLKLAQGMLVPALKVGRFRFSSATEF